MIPRLYFLEGELVHLVDFCLFNLFNFGVIIYKVYNI